MSDWLAWPGWTGVGGVLQGFAALLALKTISQASAALRQAEEDRREAVAPHWDAVPSWPPDWDQHAAKFAVVLTNSGFGPARRPDVAYEPSAGGALELIDVQPKTVVLPENKLVVRLRWQRAGEARGALVVRCASRLGERFTHRVPLRCWNDEQGDPRCEALDPVPAPRPVRRPGRFWA